MGWYLTVLKKYAVFSGRARRREYWMFILFHLVIAAVLLTVDRVLFDQPILTLIYLVAMIVPTVAVVVRRLHDTGRSGWWYLLNFVPLVGLVVFVFVCSSGNIGPNEYGPDPTLPAPDNTTPAYV
jgi:uncharacterized membrane protein YhaH (DUF805 family)